MKLEGKIIDFLGDSITEGFEVSDVENNRYDNVIKKRCNLKAVYNYGIGGSRIAYQTKPSEKPRHDLCFCGRSYDLNHNADIIIVFGGVNDYFHGDAPVGKDGDNTPETFYGAVEWLMSFLKKEYIDKKIIFIAPAHCKFDKFPSQQKTNSHDAMPLIEYVKIIIDTAKRHNIPVLNMYEELGLDPNNLQIEQEYMPDGIHFNDKGHSVLADKIIDFLENLII